MIPRYEGYLQKKKQKIRRKEKKREEQMQKGRMMRMGREEERERWTKRAGKVDED